MTCRIRSARYSVDAASCRVGSLIACTLLILSAVACSPKPDTGYKPEPSALELNNTAVAQMQQKDFHAALDSVDKAIAADPKFYTAYANRGAILSGMGMDKDAIAALRQSITINPDFAEAYVPLGALYEKQNKRPYAKKHYAVAVKLYRAESEKQPDDANIAANLAVALFLNDDRAGALDVVTAFLKQHPNSEVLQQVKTKILARDHDGLVNRPSAK